MFRRVAVLIVILLAASGCTDPRSLSSEGGSPPDPRELFVAPSGDDANTGLSAPDAFSTISHAVGEALPGDTVYVLPGTYREQVRIEARGTAALPIVLMGINGLPVIDGDGLLPMGIECAACEHVEISCLEIVGYTSAGISVQDGAAVTLRDLVISDMGAHAVAVGSTSGLLVEWLDVSRTGLVDPTAAGIRVDRQSNGTVRNNRSYQNDGADYDIDGSLVVTERNESF